MQVLRSGNVLNTAKQLFKFNKIKFGKIFMIVFSKIMGNRYQLQL